MENKIKCEICQKEFGIISPTHLKKCHGISLGEYKILYPNSPIVSKSASKKLSENIKSRNIGFKKGCKHKNHTTWNKGLTKETDVRVKLYSDKLSRPLTSEHKLNLSISKTKHQKYSTCGSCGKNKSKTNRILCRSCSQIIRSKNFINPMKGKKLSEEHKMKLWGGWKTSFTKPEMKILESYGLYGLLYTGDGSKWLKFKDGKSKNPDFVWGNYKICIEMFGDYWHKDEDPNELIRKYDEIGWKCLVLWESEVNSLTITSLSERINQFINYDNYFPFSDKDVINYSERFIIQ